MMWVDLWFLPDFRYVIDLVWHFFPWLSPFFINSFVIQEEVLQSPDIPIMSTNTEMSPYTSSFNTHWSRSQDIPILSLHSSKEELSVSLNTQSQVPDESETIRHSHLPGIRESATGPRFFFLTSSTVSQVFPRLPKLRWLSREPVQSSNVDWLLLFGNKLLVLHSVSSNNTPHPNGSVKNLDGRPTTGVSIFFVYYSG